jgi:hypothetical protein
MSFSYISNSPKSPFEKVNTRFTFSDFALDMLWMEHWDLLVESVPL